MPSKIRYEIDRTRTGLTAAVADPRVREISRDDLDGLARLMLDAYMGTIDYDDETLEDAISEVGSFFDGRPLLEASHVVEEEGRIVSAILISWLEGRPFISYVMTLPSHKQLGLARHLSVVTLNRLAAYGHEKVVLYITEGNLASEALFRSVGAVQTAG